MFLKIVKIVKNVKIYCPIQFLDVNDDLKSRSGSPDEIPVVPASSNSEENMCPICHEEFDQFYKQDFADMSSGEGKYTMIKHDPT